MAQPNQIQKYGWRVVEWSGAVGISRSTAYELMQSKAIESVRLGGARIITTPPEAFLKSLGEGG
jgi:hypothetical protein